MSAQCSAAEPEVRAIAGNSIDTPIPTSDRTIEPNPDIIASLIDVQVTIQNDTNDDFFLVDFSKPPGTSYSTEPPLQISPREQAFVQLVPVREGSNEDIGTHGWFLYRSRRDDGAVNTFYFRIDTPGNGQEGVYTCVAPPHYENTVEIRERTVFGVVVEFNIFKRDASKLGINPFVERV